MNEKRYLIEVLLKAREQVTQVAQKAARSLEDVVKAQDNLNKSAGAADDVSRRQITTLQQLVAAHTREKKALEESAAIYRYRAQAQREGANAARQELEQLQKQSRIERSLADEKKKRDIEEVARLRLIVAEREAADVKQDRQYRAETSRLRKEAALLDALASENAAANQRQAAQLGVQIAARQQDVRERQRASTAAERTANIEQRAYESVSRSLQSSQSQLEKLTSSTNDAERSHSRFGRTLQNLGFQSGDTRESLRGLNSEFQGFQLALIIKYAQSLISALAALGAQLVAVGAAAGQAAAGLGAALGAGMAQAIPVVAVLGASFARFADILKVVKQRNQQQLTATHDATRAAHQQTSASDSIRSAEERVADAHRNTQRALQDLSRTRSDASREELHAQEEVNRARREAIRTVQDLILAERGAVQSVEQAQSALQDAVRSGDVAGAAQGQLDVDQAQLGLRRARQDAAPVRARGVEGVQAVADAEQRLTDIRRTNARQFAQASQAVTDARRSEVRATEDLARTRATAADNLAQETAAADKLTDMLNQLSPAEQNLYRRILALQETYKRVARPITDIIVGAFSDVVDRVIKALRDPRILGGFRSIAVQIAGSIRQITGVAGGERSIGAFQILSAEATRNIPIATRILIDFFEAARNIVLAAIPAFRLLLGYVEDYAGKASDATENSKGLSDFFVTGVQYAHSFFELLLSIAGLFLTIAGRDGAAGEGIKTIDELTRRVDGLTDKARDNAGAIRDFFAKTRDAFFLVLGVVANLASTLVSAFSLPAIQSFADFLNRIVIPAVGDTVKIMGALVTVFHEFVSLPGVAPVLQILGTGLLLAKGLTIVRLAILDLGEILPTFLKAFGLLIPVIDEATGAVVGFELAAAGPIILAIAAVIGAIVLLDRHFHFLGPTFRWLRNAAGDVFDWLKRAAQDVVDYFSDVWNQGLLKWIRYPFKGAFDTPVFHAIVDAAKAVVGFFSHGSGQGAWRDLRGLLEAPFNGLYNFIRLTFHLIRTLVTVFLDVLAGRFGEAGDEIKGLFDDVIDTLAGAATSLLSILETVLGAFGKIPGIGGPFKAAAEAINDARGSIDNWRESLRKNDESTSKNTGTIDHHALRIVNLQEKYEEARDKQGKLKKGTNEYRRAAELTRQTSEDLADAVKRTGGSARDARKPVSVLRGNIEDLADASQETTDALVADLNTSLRAFGAKAVHISVRRARKAIHGRQLSIRDTELATGGIPNYGAGARDDHILLDPYGTPVAAMSGSEGVINRPQMAVINSALGFAQAAGGLPWGSLSDLWGSGMRHYAEGGGLQPAIRTVSNRLDKMFGLQTTSGYRTSMPLGHPDYHNVGIAADISGPPDNMMRAVRYIMNSGLWRQLLEGIHNPGLSIKNGQRVPSSFWGPSTWGDHIDHIHLALRRFTGALGDAVGALRAPRVTGPDGPLTDLIKAGAGRKTRAANKYLNRVLERVGGGDPKAMGADANVVSAFRRAIRVTGANQTEKLALWEAGIVESNLRNLNYGDRDSLGSLQERAGIYGRAHALNPYASAIRFLTQAKSRRPWRGSAGSLAQAVQVSAFPGRYDAVRGKAMRYLQTGGPLKGIVAPPQRQIGNQAPIALRGALARMMDSANDVLGGIASALAPLTRSGGRAKGFALRIQHAFTLLTKNGGLLDQLSTSVENIAIRGAARLQRLQFRVTRAGPRRTGMSDTEVARANFGITQSTGTALQREAATLDQDLVTAQQQLAIAQARKNKDAAKIAQVSINNLRTRITTVAGAIAQNIQDQVEAQENFQQALFDSVNDAASNYNDTLDRWSRVAKAMGRSVDPNVLLGAQIGNMQRQIGGLQGVLARAQSTGNTKLADTVRSQIDELNTQIAEAVAQQFQNSIDAVNNAAAASGARLDRATRRAQIGGTNYEALGAIFNQRAGVLSTQRSGLAGLLGYAYATGNYDQIINLTDQIDELDTSMAENTQAIRDNTDEAFNARTQRINEAAQFSTGIFSSAQSFFQALSEATGIDTTMQQRAALGSSGVALATQGTALRGQLAQIMQLSPDWTAWLQGLTGSGLVSYLSSLVASPEFQTWLASMDTTQQQSFKDLISSLIENSTAIQQNTQAVTALTSPTQNFSSTMWTRFREAIFTGTGQLLPQYRSYIPSAEIGARVHTSGTLMVHAGETVRPAAISRDYGREMGGDTYQLNVTSPTEVLNPTDVARQLAFYRKTQGRR